MKKILLTVVLLLCFSAITTYAEGPFKDVQFQTACEEAKKAEKVIIIDFFTTWCGPCKKMDTTTWKDETVQSFLKEKAIALKIDAEKEVDLATRYKINAYPTILILKADGTEIDRIIGYRPATDFLSETKDALAGKTALVRAKEKITPDKENDPEIRFEYADVLVQVGKYKEALDEYLWCYDHGLEYDQAFSGVRLSFLLSAIVDLGGRYPEAIQALKQRRDLAEQQLLSDQGKVEQVYDFAALNRELKDKPRSLKAYDKLKQAKASKLESAILNYVIEDLLLAHRYSDILDTVSDCNKMVEQQIKNYQTLENFYKDKKEISNSDHGLPVIKKLTINKSANFYEALLGVKQFENADKIETQIISFSSSKEVFTELINRANRVENKEKVKSLLGQAAKVLPESDYLLVQKAVEENKK